MCASGSRHVHEDVVAVDANRVGRNGGAARGKRALAGPDVEHPAVPGTGEPGPAELALAQRAASVRADIAAGIELISGAGQVFDSNGRVADAATRDRIRAFVEGFAAFVEKQRS